MGDAPLLNQSGDAIWQQWWRIAAIAGSAIVGALALIALLAGLAHALLLLFGAIVIANALAPVVAWLEQRLPRTLAVVLVYVALSLGLGAFGWVVAPRLAEQAQQFVLAAPSLVNQVRTVVAGWDPTNSNQILAIVQQRMSGFGMSLLSLPVTLVTGLVEIIFVVLMSAYWLGAAPALRRFTLSLLPPERRAEASDVLAEIGQTAGGYVRGKGLAVLIVGAATFGGLTVIGVDFPLVLALIAGAAELIPLVGVYIATVPAVAIALTDSPTQALMVLGFYVLLQQIESNLLLPALLRHQAGIPALLAVFALFAGEQLAGILGALIAIPLAGAVQVIAVRVVAPALRRWTGAPRVES